MRKIATLALLLSLFVFAVQPTHAIEPGQAVCVGSTDKSVARVTDLKIAHVGSTGIVFYFKVPTDPSGIVAIEYKLRVGTVLTAQTWAETTNVSGTITQEFVGGKLVYLQLSGLSPNPEQDLAKRYSFAVKAKDGCGNVGPTMSNVPAQFMTKAAESNDAVVFWEAVPDAVSYAVYYGDQETTPDSYEEYEYLSCGGTTATFCKISASLSSPNSYMAIVKRLANGTNVLYDGPSQGYYYVP